MKTRIAESDQYYIEGDLQRPVSAGTTIVKIDKNKELRMILLNGKVGPRVSIINAIKKKIKEAAERKKGKTVGVCTGEFFNYYYISKGASQEVDSGVPIIWKETPKGSKKLTVILGGKEVKIYRTSSINSKLGKNHAESSHISPSYASQREPQSQRPEHKDSSIQPVDPDDIFNFTAWPDEDSNPKEDENNDFCFSSLSDDLSYGLQQENQTTTTGRNENADVGLFDKNLFESSPVSHLPCEPEQNFTVPSISQSGQKEYSSAQPVDSTPPIRESSFDIPPVDIFAAEENPLIDWNSDSVDTNNLFNFISEPSHTQNKTNREFIDLSNDGSDSDGLNRTNFTAPKRPLARQEEVKASSRPILQNNRQPSSLLEQTILRGWKHSQQPKPQPPTDDALVKATLSNWKRPNLSTPSQQEAKTPPRSTIETRQNDTPNLQQRQLSEKTNRKTIIVGSEQVNHEYFFNGDIQKPVPDGTTIVTLGNEKSRELYILLSNGELGPKVSIKGRAAQKAKDAAEREKGLTVGVCTSEFYEYYYVDSNGTSQNVKPGLPIIWNETEKGTKRSVILAGREIAIYRAGDIAKILRRREKKSLSGQAEVLDSDKQTETVELNQCAAQPEHKDSSIHLFSAEKNPDPRLWPDESSNPIDCQDRSNPKVVGPDDFFFSLPGALSCEREDDPDLFDGNLFGFSPVSDTHCRAEQNFVAPSQEEVKTPSRPIEEYLYDIQKLAQKLTSPPKDLMILIEDEKAENKRSYELAQQRLENLKKSNEARQPEKQTHDTTELVQQELARQRFQNFKQLVQTRQAELAAKPAKKRKKTSSKNTTHSQAAAPTSAPSHDPTPAASSCQSFFLPPQLPVQCMLPPMPTYPGISLFNPIGNYPPLDPLTMRQQQEEYQAYLERFLQNRSPI